MSSFIALLTAAIALSAAIQNRAGTTIFPGAIASADGSTGYFPAPGGKLQAIELGTGRQKWVSSAGGYPLALVGNRMVAADLGPDGRSLFIKTMSLEGVEISSAGVALPSWVVPRFGYQVGPGAFALDAQIQDDRTILVRWTARQIPPGRMRADQKLLADSAIYELAMNDTLSRFGSGSFPLPERKGWAEGGIDNADPSANVLYSAMIGRRRYLIVVAPMLRDQDETPVYIRAFDNGKRLWQVQVGTIARIQLPAGRGS